MNNINKMNNAIECIICRENITNEFCMTSCGCAFAIFHQACINEWTKIKYTYPCCNQTFNIKPIIKRYKSITPYIPPHNNNRFEIFAFNYNFLRIMMGRSTLQYSN